MDRQCLVTPSIMRNIGETKVNQRYRLKRNLRLWRTRIPRWRIIDRSIGNDVGISDMISIGLLW